MPALLGDRPSLFELTLWFALVILTPALYQITSCTTLLYLHGNKALLMSSPCCSWVLLTTLTVLSDSSMDPAHDLPDIVRLVQIEDWLHQDAAQMAAMSANLRQATSSGLHMSFCFQHPVGSPLGSFHWDKWRHTVSGLNHPPLMITQPVKYTTLYKKKTKMPETV